MRQTIAIATAGLAVLALAACGTVVDQFDDKYQRAQEAEVQGADFDRKLYEGYLEAAGRERAEFDWPASRRFAIKALEAADGQRVAPDLLRDHSLPSESEAELSKARKQLVTALYGGAAGLNAEQAARAQVAFDCWIQEAAEDHQAEDIAACRDNFYASMEALQRPPYLVYFPLGSANVDDDGKILVKKAAAAVKTGFTSKITVVGHADQVGPSEVNMTLSQKRADEVKRLLEMSGVPADKIEAIGRGDTAPEVTAAAGTPEAGNRRAEIKFAP
ncbi:MAG: OmpA family protein [Kiloniellales bacterium]|nr:OmpA family protein [Kiloniellales bacterium]